MTALLASQSLRLSSLLAAALAAIALAQPVPLAGPHSHITRPRTAHAVDVRPPVMAEAASLAAAPPPGPAPVAAYGPGHPQALGPKQVLMPMSSSPLERQVLGFVNAGSLTSATGGYTTWKMSLLSTVAFFGLPVWPGDGTVNTSSTGWQVIYSPAMTSFVNAAHAAGTRVIVSFNAFGNVCGQLSPASTQNTINIAVQQIHQHNLDGINVDYEGDDITCPNGLRARDELVTFVQHLRATLPNYYIAIDTYSGSAEDNLEFFNITGLEPYVDAYFVMAYDMDYANYGQAPLNCASYCFNPISPLNTYRFNVTNSMAQYSALVPSSKVILGQPYYGRRGCVANLTDAHQLANTSKNFATPTYQYASTIPSQGGVVNFAAHRDPSDGVSEWDTWYDTDWSCNREQYWDDIVSLGSKYDLVNQDNLGGVGFFTLDYAGGATEAWNSIATHFTQIPGLPGSVAACATNGSAVVSWTAAPTRGSAISKYVVTADPGGTQTTVGGNATFATMTGLTPGTPYTLSVRGYNANGAGLVSETDSVTPWPASPVATSYLSWYDNATVGMLGDNVHLLNHDPSNPSVGCITLTGQQVLPFNLPAGAEQHFAFPKGTIGGPVVVDVYSGPAVLASQRVQYYQSFNEVWARSASQAQATDYINWFDRASPGMVADNIHIVNPGVGAATVSVSLPGAPTVNATVGPGGESYVTFPKGTIGGPVTITASGPVLASQRVQYYNSFNEVSARGAADAAKNTYFNWFDRATVGMAGDNVHVLNPGTTAANVTVRLTGATAVTFSLPPGAEHVATFPSNTIGGPVTITADQPVLASQRVQYFQSFNEVAGSPAAQATTTSYVMWFDKATEGMVSDNIHVLNPGTAAASVTVALGGVVSSVTVGAGLEVHVTFPVMTIGGPVVITSTQPVLAAQRVQYFQSFNEEPAAT